MKVLIIGGTGSLGSALAGEADARGWDVVSSGSRSGDLICDIRDLNALDRLLESVDADTVINAAALVDLGLCEAQPGQAWMVNARPVAALARWSSRQKRRLVQVSTDHYYVGDGDIAHAEDANVTLVNEYARSKYAAETFALTDSNALVLRTTFVGKSPMEERSTFFDWVVKSLEDGDPMTLFEDAFFSPIEVSALAVAICDLMQGEATGVLNVAGHEVVSKADFIRAVAQFRGNALDNTKTGSVEMLSPRRGDSLGLDVSRAQALLGRRLPGLECAVQALCSP